jgi:hypothetical protein
LANDSPGSCLCTGAGSLPRSYPSAPPDGLPPLKNSCSLGGGAPYDPPYPPPDGGGGGGPLASSTTGPNRLLFGSGVCNGRTRHDPQSVAQWGMAVVQDKRLTSFVPVTALVCAGLHMMKLDDIFRLTCYCVGREVAMALVANMGNAGRTDMIAPASPLARRITCLSHGGHCLHALPTRHFGFPVY